MECEPWKWYHYVFLALAIPGGITIGIMISDFQDTLNKIMEKRHHAD